MRSQSGPVHLAALELCLCCRRVPFRTIVLQNSGRCGMLLPGPKGGDTVKKPAMLLTVLLALALCLVCAACGPAAEEPASDEPAAENQSGAGETEDQSDAENPSSAGEVEEQPAAGGEAAPAVGDPSNGGGVADEVEPDLVLENVTDTDDAPQPDGEEDYTPASGSENDTPDVPLD